MRASLAALTIVWAAACVDGSVPGDRRAAADRCANSIGCDAESTCPSGESCSSITPNGLSFFGALLGAHLPTFVATLEPTAVGGVQRIQVDGLPWVMSSPFGPTITATIAGDAFELVEVNLPIIVVRGRAEGTAMLRVVHGIGLLDRISIEARALDHTELIVPDAEASFGATHPGTAVLAQSTVPVVAAMFDVEDRRLVDQAVRIDTSTVPLGLALVGVGWDFVEVRAERSGSVGFGMFAAGQMRSATIFAVDQADHIAWDYGDDQRTDLAMTQWNGAAYTGPAVCFRAWSGARVVSVPSWQFTATAGITVEPTRTIGTTGCVELRGGRGKLGTLTISAGGAHRDVGLRFQAP